MKSTLYLAWRHLRFFRVRSAILVLGLTLTIALPVASHLIISQYGIALRARAEATPYVLGARGNRFDLVLKTLYFSDAQVAPIALEDSDQVQRSEWAKAIPLHLAHTAKGHPIVGTPDDYFAFRKLKARVGEVDPQLGEVVLGAEVARKLQLKIDDRLLSDRHGLYDIGGKYPVRMTVVGILEPANSPDDHAVFVSLDTTWLIDGLMHGHAGETHQAGQDPTSKPIEFHEVTPENRSSFHIHAFPAEIPVSAVIVIPNGNKGATILNARYENHDRVQLQRSADVVEEILGLVVQIRTFFDTYYAFVMIATLLFVGLIVALSMQLRRGEMETMRLIGASRGFAIRLQATELLIIVAISAVLSSALTLIFMQLAQQRIGIG